MSVSCQIGSIRRLSKCDIPGVGTMVLAATGNSSRNVAKDLAAINTLAAKAHKVQSVQLVLLGSITVALPEDIVCPWLTDLAVTAPTGATTVVQLVRQLPNLTNIRLSSVFLDDLRAKSPQHTVVDDCVGPFDSRIEMLSLNFARTEKLGALHVVFAVGLVARLPAAKTLRAIQLPIGPTIARVEELRPQAPRLADIAYLLDAQS
ncbi:hypothetical protein LPJ61_005720 [Coemansia biformis]|uniref:Uncharacterized protein n=1 Tax=Coemansia biformis TaxID=1286918 RepID=A0A9W7Y739_9FUNG|nr:hypothetical protein LPJ61_005720 [Coemansia biformis]